MTRGLSFPTAQPFAPSNDPAGATLVVGGKSVLPAFVGIAPLTVVGHDDPAYAHQLRLYVPLGDLVPDAQGEFPVTLLEVATRDSALVDTVPIPAAILRQVWREAIGWRVERLGAVALSPAALHLPAPRDSVLSRGHAQYIAGNQLEAGRIARWHLGSREEGDRRLARVIVGSMLLSGGDSVAGRLVLADALAEAPCLSISAKVPASLRTPLDQMRPIMRCETASPLRVLATGLLAPGVGQWTTGRRRGAIPLAAATAAVFGYALLELSGSRSSYASYKTATSTEDAVRFHKSAVNGQTRAGNVAIAGAVIWAAGAIEAAIVEYLHARSVARVRSYGGR